MADEGNWDREMARTRAAYGHDVPSRKGAANTVMYHQVIAFNPDETAPSGKVTPEFAMDYAREWVQRRYPDHEAVWVLHREHCAADGTDRLAVHIAINRTDLATGRRLDEGPSRIAKVERANAIRDMDREHGLRQMERGVRNSRTHARQPTRAEREMEGRGLRTDKRYIREAVRASVREVSRAPARERSAAFAKVLEAKGVRVDVPKGGGDLTFERVRSGTRVSGTKLGRGFSRPGIAHALGMAAARTMARAIEEGLEA